MLLLLLLALVGCQTFKDIQHQPPGYSLNSEIAPQPLANKFASEAAQESIDAKFFPRWNPPHIVELNGTYKMLISFTRRHHLLLIAYPPETVAELSISPESSGGSRIEYRAINWSGKEPLWALVKKCAIKTPPGNMPD